MYYQVNMHYGLRNHSPTQEVVWLTFNFTTCQHHDMRDEPSFDRKCSKFSWRFVGDAPTSARYLMIVLTVQHSHASNPVGFTLSGLASKLKGGWYSIKHRLTGGSLTHSLFWQPVYQGLFLCVPGGSR